MLTLRERWLVSIGSLAALTIGSALTIAAVEVLTAAQSAAGPAHRSREQALAAVAGSYLLGLMTVIVWFVAVFVVAAMAAFAASLRRRELALLRAIGATPGQVRRLVLSEAGLLAVVGGALGAVLSPAVSRVLVARLAAHGMAPAGLHPVLTPAAIPVGCTLMLGVALAGTWRTARRSARIRPTEALLEAAVDHKVMTVARWVGGLSSLALALVVAARTADSSDGQGQLAVTFCTAVLVTTGLTMLAPVLVPRLCALVLRLVPHGRLARWHARVAVRRTAALATPVLLCAAVTAAMGTVIDSVQAGVVTHVADPTDSSNMNPAFLSMVVTVLVIYVSVSLAGIAAMSTAARATELVELRFSGATRVQAVWSVGLETLVAALVGAGLGLAGSATGLVGHLHRGGAHSDGPVVVPWGLLVVVTATCAAAATLASVLVATCGPAGSRYLGASAAA